jgi:hypothetical protein
MTNPSGAPEFTLVFSGVRVTRSLVLCVCFVDRCLSFVLFLLTIVLSVLLLTIVLSVLLLTIVLSVLLLAIVLMSYRTTLIFNHLNIFKTHALPPSPV